MRTFTYSVFDIYGTTEPKIPVGWVDIDFRPPGVKDTFMHREGFVDEAPADMPKELEEEVFLYETPYLILRKKRGAKKAVLTGRTSGGKKPKKR